MSAGRAPTARGQSPHDPDELVRGRVVWTPEASTGSRLCDGTAPGSILPAGSRPAGIGHEPSPVRQAIVGCSKRPALTSTSGILPAGSWSDGRDSDGPLLCWPRPASIASTRQARQRGIALRSPRESRLAQTSHG